MGRKQIQLKDCGTILQYLEETQAPVWKKYHANRTCFHVYNELKTNLAPITRDVERGAMAAEINQLLAGYSAKYNSIPIEDSKARVQLIEQIISSDPVILLNNHGEEHIAMVINRASEIIKHFHGQQLSEFEAFILLCAIEIHDIGNILGRTGHERNLIELFDDKSKELIPDTAERRVIKSIAVAHGGKNSSGEKDTISCLEYSELLFDSRVRTKLLAAILRFADELADDYTRASRGLLDLNAIGVNSKIYQDYSRVLHSVVIEPIDNQYDNAVHLVYELEASDLKEPYYRGDKTLYLIDEIYERSLKMERERRYCQKFLNPVVSISRIKVAINIYYSCTEHETISYTLEDHAYPDDPKGSAIKDIIGSSYKSGADYAAKICKGE